MLTLQDLCSIDFSALDFHVRLVILLAGFSGLLGSAGVLNDMSVYQLWFNVFFFFFWFNFDPEEKVHLDTMALSC